MAQAASATPNELARVVDLHEGAKTILGYSREVNLRALDAMVRSLRGSQQLRGFNEVASQMRQWCRELSLVADQLTELAASQVKLVSTFLEQQRLHSLLLQATHGKTQFREIVEQSRRDTDQRRDALKRVRRKVRNSLEDLAQLGLMAAVLSRSALIEAASGDAESSRDLSIVSSEFSTRSGEINETISALLKREREAIS